MYDFPSPKTIIILGNLKTVWTGLIHLFHKRGGVVNEKVVVTIGGAGEVPPSDSLTPLSQHRKELGTWEKPQKIAELPVSSFLL